MENYKNNSDRTRENRQNEKKVEAVVTSSVKTRRKGKIGRFIGAIIAEDADNVASALISEIMIPAVKKAISDIVTTGIDMFLYGESGSRRRDTAASKVSYRNYYDRESDRARTSSVHNRGGLDYDEIIFASRGDAEAVLDALNDIISQYGTASVSDLYDLARVPNDNYTMNRYGWTNIGGAAAVRVRDGYVLKLPRAIPLN